jgi:membrane-associated HD superfamily phosphohydrolase
MSDSRDAQSPPELLGGNRLQDLHRHQRRRVLARNLMTIIGSWILLFLVFFAEPSKGFGSTRPTIMLTVGITVVLAMLYLQYRQITSARYPMVRAAVAICIVIPFFLVVFSMMYLAMSASSPSSFSQHLDHVRALYFTITTFSTVGFGDITPTSDVARMVVSTQMLLDLALIGVGVRLLFNVAKTGMENSRNTPSASRDESAADS